jgi:hypothetical protein
MYVGISSAETGNKTSKRQQGDITQQNKNTPYFSDWPMPRFQEGMTQQKRMQHSHEKHR